MACSGPEDARWYEVKEERGQEQPDPDTPGGGIVDVTSTYEAPRLQLYTHPGQDCVPILNISQDEVRYGQIAPLGGRRSSVAGAISGVSVAVTGPLNCLGPCL